MSEIPTSYKSDVNLSVGTGKQTQQPKTQE